MENGIYFVMKLPDKESFLRLPGLEELVKRLKEEGFRCFFKTVEEADFCFRGRALGNDLQKDYIIVTDYPPLAVRLSLQGECVIGFRPGDELLSGSFFEGADTLLTDFRGLKPSFFSNELRRFNHLPLIIAGTRRLLIRESVEADYPDILCLEKENDPAEDNDDNEDYQKFISYIKYQYSFFGFGLWTVVEKDSGEIVGRTGISWVSDDESSEGRPELAYQIRWDRRRLGYAYEACKAVIAYAFDELDIDRLYARIEKGNLPSQKTALKLGFQKLAKGGTEKRDGLSGKGVDDSDSAKTAISTESGLLVYSGCSSYDKKETVPGTVSTDTGNCEADNHEPDLWLLKRRYDF